MTARIDIRVVVALLGLALAAYASCSPEPAYADETDETRGVMLEGDVLERRSEGAVVSRTVLPGWRLVIDRGQVDQANACPTAKAELEAKLSETLVVAERMSAPEPRWRVATRWAAVGGAVVGAFIAGAALF